MRLKDDCRYGLEGATSENDEPVFTILCPNDEPAFGGMYRDVDFARYLGKRVRVSGSFRVAGIQDMRTPSGTIIEGGGALWISVGSPSAGVRMDRMANRALKGTTSWEYRDFVVDIPQDNNRFQIGIWMQGKGQLWVRDLNIEEVPLTVPVSFHWDDPNKPVGPDLSLE